MRCKSKKKENFIDTREEKKELISSMISLKHKLNNSITGFLAMISLLEERDKGKKETEPIEIEGKDLYCLMKEEIDNIREILESFPA